MPLPIRWTFLLTLAAAAGCSNEDSALTAADAAASDDASASAELTEKPLDVVLELLTTGDGGTGVLIPTGSPTAARISGLQITARDGTTPVCTDLWIYTLVDGQLQPFTAFSGASNRKTGRLMMPATIGGTPSNLTPADDGRTNGIMTDAVRGTVVQGAFVSTIDGTTQIMLAAPPTDPIVVVAAVEDQRYAGAAAIMPDGTAGTVPTGVGVPETHRRRSYNLDVRPMLEAQCTKLCHNDSGPLDAPLYKMERLDDLLNDNYALSEGTEDCQAKYPSDKVAFGACVQAITKAQFLIEPGAPALSDILTRARPDEEANASTLGLAWFGGGTPKSRYNAGYGDRRMPSTTFSTDPADWKNEPTWFDQHPADYQVLWDWVAQGAQP